MDYFEEKTDQVSPDTLISFGIRINSRYGKAWQIVEMLRFTETLAEQNLHSYVESIFYDSKNDTCSFQLLADNLTSAQKTTILMCADLYISQFEWDGTIHHGEPMGAV